MEARPSQGTGRQRASQPGRLLHAITTATIPPCGGIITMRSDNSKVAERFPAREPAGIFG